jgi:hypothetical protein
MLDFIERHLGFSPDNGDGSFEFLIVTATAVTIAFLGVYWFHPHQSKRDAS